MPVSLSMREIVYRRQVTVNSLKRVKSEGGHGVPCPYNGIASGNQSRAAQNSKMRSRADLTATANGSGRSFVEEQDHAIEFALAGATGEREADRMKDLAATNANAVLQGCR